jgi:hypothetical protein
MSIAATVPETRGELEGDDAFETARAIGLRALLRDSFVRFRYADGFSVVSDARRSPRSRQAAGVVAKQATIRWTRRESSLGMEGSIVNRARGAHRGIVRKALEVIHVAGLLAHSLEPALHRREAVHLEPALMGAVDIAV